MRSIKNLILFYMTFIQKGGILSMYDAHILSEGMRMPDMRVQIQKEGIP